jgi:hypothetical protein
LRGGAVGGKTAVIAANDRPSLMPKRPFLAAAIAAAVLAPLPASWAQAPSAGGWTAEQDHRNMMDQLEISALRPGPSGDEAAPDHANYDEAKANPFPDWPDILTTKAGQKVTTADQSRPSSARCWAACPGTRRR